MPNGEVGIVLGEEVERSNGSEGKHGLEAADSETLMACEPEPRTAAFRDHPPNILGDGDFEASQTLHPLGQGSQNGYPKSRTRLRVISTGKANEGMCPDNKMCTRRV